MSIKIIKRGKKKERIFKLKCPECGTVFSFSESDARREYSRNLITYSINCPVCTHFMYVND